MQSSSFPAPFSLKINPMVYLIFFSDAAVNFRQASQYFPRTIKRKTNNKYWTFLYVYLVCQRSISKFWFMSFSLVPSFPFLLDALIILTLAWYFFSLWFIIAEYFYPLFSEYKSARDKTEINECIFGIIRRKLHFYERKTNFKLHQTK